MSFPALTGNLAMKQGLFRKFCHQINRFARLVTKNLNKVTHFGLVGLGSGNFRVTKYP